VFGPGQHFYSADVLPEGATFDAQLHGHWSAQAGPDPLQSRSSCAARRCKAFHDQERPRQHGRPPRRSHRRRPLRRRASVPPEPALCEELGVSRTVVREAVKSLIAKGLVTTGPKVGTRVLPSENWNWFDPDVVGMAVQGRPHGANSCATCRTCGAWSSRPRCAWPPNAPRRRHRRHRAAFKGMRRAVEEGGDYVTYDLRSTRACCAPAATACWCR
jgi:hypothetical protein